MAQDKHPLLIQNCPVAFRFRCKKSWDQLELTSSENIRYCGQFRKNVYLVSTDAEIGWAIRTNQCIAWRLPSNLREEIDEPVLYVGQPHDEVVGQPHDELGELTRAVVSNAKESEWG